MDEQEHNNIMNRIVRSLREAGYDPYEQLTGYLLTGEDFYITRHNNARNEVKKINTAWLIQYINRELKQK